MAIAANVYLSLSLYSPLIFLLPRTVSAAYDQFHFSTASSQFKCEGSPFGCPAPSVCTHDNIIDKWYCCIPGEGSICWGTSQGCNGTPSSTQISCGSGDTTFCCLKNREMCTQTTDQINICWAQGTANPFLNKTSQEMNATFSSLSSAAPSATALNFALAQIGDTSTSVSTTSTSSTSSTSSASSTTSSAPSTSSPAPTSSSSSSLSTGAIAGIAVAAVVIVLLTLTIGILLWRRKRHASSDANGHGSVAPIHKYAHEAQGPGLSELQSTEYAQLPTNSGDKFAQRGQFGPVELDAQTPAVEIGTTSGKKEGR